ncbi:MarR family winged helix-turn-helix transcriptional regulator [Modestobacter sp. I12A-02662]|uniref:MarR family winged helix-turn-helix transcriptional regulator n=1 Tax=Modestobacter sp. I12A-02662 TaxID=1730496 RepID=UPI0034DFBFD8
MQQAGPGGPSSHVDLFHAASVGLAARVEGVLAGAELTLDQWRVLRTLVERGPLSMTELAGLTRVTGPTLTRIVDRLVERSLLYRNVDAADRRRVVVHAGDRGRALEGSLAPRIAEAERTGLAALSETETRTLRRLLERLATDPEPHPAG